MPTFGQALRAHLELRIHPGPLHPLAPVAFCAVLEKAQERRAWLATKKRFPEAEAGAKTARYGWLEECFGTSHRSCLAIWICGPSRGSLSGTPVGPGEELSVT